jgi:hypothetical protein
VGTGATCVIGGFEMPSFTVWKVVFTAVGASVYWGMWGRTKLRPYLLPDILRYLPFKRFHPMIEFLVFLTIGCLVGIGFTNPSNPQQAITAGMGWTGVFVRRKSGSECRILSSKENEIFR